MTGTPTRVLRCAWLLFFLAVHCASMWKITTQFPTLLRFTDGDDVSAVFEADTALTSCQCRTRFNTHATEPLIDLSLGHESVMFQHEWYNASYSGAGLQFGQCGVKLQGFARYLITRLLVCRARAATGGWKHQQVVVAREDYSKFLLTALPQHVVFPGYTAVLQLCKSHGNPLRQCGIGLPDAARWTRLYATSNSTPGDKLSYAGLDIARGKCTVGLNITADTHSGLVWCDAVDSDGQLSRLPTLLLVAAPPLTGPTLNLPFGATLSAGEKLTAVCTVAASRPVANITWLIGGRIVRHDNIDDLPDSKWTWPWDQQTITQIIVLKVSAEDNGQHLKCRVQHMALKERLESTQKLTVTGGRS